MNPLRIKAENYGPYARLNWEPPVGLTAVVGVNRLGDGANSNGSGKTKLLESIPLALFGPSMPWSEYLTVGSEQETCLVELEFEHGGKVYRVRRTYSAKGRGKTSLDFERLVRYESPAAIDTWEPLTRDRQDETQRLVDATIGLSEATFAHSVFAAQGARHFADPSLPPRERKAILTEALGLETWDVLLAAVRKDIATVSTELVAIGATIGSAEADLANRAEAELEWARLKDESLRATDEVERAESNERIVRNMHAEVQGRAQRAAAITARHTAAQQTYDTLRAKAEQAAQARVQIVELQAELDQLRPLAGDRDARQAALSELEQAETVRQAALERKRQIEQQAADLDRQANAKRMEARTHADLAAAQTAEAKRVESGEVERCSHCKQPLNEAAREEALQSTLAEVKVLTERADTLTREADALDGRAGAVRLEGAEIVVPRPHEPSQVEQARAAVAEAQDAAGRLAMLEERRRNAEEVAASDSEGFRALLGEAHTALAAAAVDLAEAGTVNEEALAEAAAALTTVEAQVQAARSRDRDLQAQLAASGERVKHLASLAQRVQESLAARAGLQARFDDLKALERAYGRDGIPALILESSAIPQVEHEAQRVLEELGMPFRVELVTQRENKGGGLKDTLDVVVHEPNGARRYETYSGGERTRLELALRIALARLIAHRRSAQVGMLALDEPAFLDLAGHTQLANVLRGLTEFGTICVVSHDESLVDAFDNWITVVRDESGSRLLEVA